MRLDRSADKVSIRTITYDDKSKTVTISGPFDAEEVADRLTSAAGKVITDMHVAGGGGGQKHAFNAPAAKGGKADGHSLFGFGGGGHKHHQGKGHGGGGGGGHKHQDKGHGGGGGNKQQETKVHGGAGKQQETKQGHHGGGKAAEKKHVNFDFDDMSDDDYFDDDLPPHGHGHHGAGKPKIVTTTSAPVAARLDAPRTGPSVPMAAAAPMRMPAGPAGMMMAPPQHHQQQQQPHNAMATPSIWPAPSAAPEWGYSAPSQYAGYPAGGGYYGGVPAAAAAYGYGRAPYGAPPQYYEEEPSAGCSIM
jgi:hypothetical protein